jgi:uncharacterized protein (TIGR01244 family)
MFRKLTDSIYASPQITLEDVAEAAAMGVKLIINNRPEGESDDQIPGADIETAARAAGIDYVAIPVTHAGFTSHTWSRWPNLMNRGPVLAIAARARSTLLWALSGKPGRRPDALTNGGEGGL